MVRIGCSLVKASAKSPHTTSSLPFPSQLRFDDYIVSHHYYACEEALFVERWSKQWCDEGILRPLILIDLTLIFEFPDRHSVWILAHFLLFIVFKI
jgi:hypothetical protein